MPTPDSTGKKQRIIKYLASGAVVVVLEYSLFLFIHYIGDVSAGLASSISFGLALAASYNLQRFWTFNNQTANSHLKAGVLYGILAVVNAVLSGYGVAFLVSYDVPAYAAKAVLIAAIAGYNYVLYQHIIFKESPHSPPK